MDEKDWLFLTAVYEEKNVTRAAQRLFISQPALTYRLKQLEEQLNIQIFVRGKRNIRFTMEGEHLALYAKKMEIELQKLKDQLQDLKDEVSGELRIGVSSNFADIELPDLLKKFHDLYPNVKFNVNTAWSVNAFERLANEQDHLGIVRGNYEWDDSKILMGVHEVCIVSKQPISLENLPKLPRIRHQSGPDTKKIAEQWWQENYAKPPYISMEVDNLETCKKMVLKGLGYGILPKYLLSEEDLANDLFIYPLTFSDGKPILRKLWAFYREDDMNLSVVKAFVNFLKENYSIE
jgi:DNA-binding transcriptional LysR family regulator